MIPLCIAGDFKVHVAEGVFYAEDVGEDGIFVIFEDEAHGNAGDRALDGNACIHQREAAAADGGHRRGAVGFGDVGLEADDVREMFHA